MKVIALAFTALLLPVSAVADGVKTYDEVVESMVGGVEHVDNAYVASRMAENPDLLILDVREPSEFEAGRLKGATSMPRGIVEFRMAGDRYGADKEIIVTCSHGFRAASVTKTLKDMGYTNVSAHRGMNSWAEGGYELETEIGMVELKAKKD